MINESQYPAYQAIFNVILYVWQLLNTLFSIC